MISSLSTLTIEGATITPALTAGVLEYAAETYAASGDITATPTNAGDTAAIKVNGEVLTGDTATWEIGTNSVEITVSGTGHVTQVYTMTVTRKSALSALSLGAATLSPAFDAELFEYTGTTSNATNTVTATALEETDDVAMVLNDTPMESTTATWAEGENVLEITVGTGSTATTYTVTVTAGE